MKKGLILCLTGIFVLFTSFGFTNVYADELYAHDLKWLCSIECPGHYIGESPCKVPVPRTLYFNTYEQPKDINTKKDVDDIIKHFKNSNYTVINKTNSSSAFMEQKEEGYSRMNRDYYFISSHGSESGHVYFGPSDYLKAQYFPDMNNVKIALFAICYGGKEGNAAQVVVNSKNVETAIGWPGLTYVTSSRTFTNKFWELIIKDKLDVSEAVEKSKKHTQNTYFYNFGLWGDNTIMDPKIYGKNTNIYLKQSNMNDVDQLHQQDNELLTEDYKIIFKRDGNYYTNRYQIVDRFSNNIIQDYYENPLKGMNGLTVKISKLSSFKILSNYIHKDYKDGLYYNQNDHKITLEQDYLLDTKDRNQIQVKRIQVQYFGEYNILEEFYFDLTNLKLLTESEMASHFQLPNNIRKRVI